MKSAYELAMERLNKTTPTVKLNDDQKKQIAELDSKYAAKIAEREISLNGEIERAAGKGDFEEMEKVKLHLISERKRLQAELEDKKEEVRQRKS